ncbi:MAG: dihydrolipoyl dehydrogenase [Gammaproteobacteria bacterium]|nr:dihydrolipoyl dehydrogenase [Gammaproteobacteria bacterium]
MAKIVDVYIPNIGEFENVDVIEVFVKPGSQVKKEDSLITLESDKATMEIPSPYDGKVKELKVAVGNKVSTDSLILTMEVAEGQRAAKVKKAPIDKPAAGAAARRTVPTREVRCDVAVLGSGPGGYTAAFRAADLGKKTVLIERYPSLGGVCLNVGCIPSKALLHVAGVIVEAAEMENQGVSFGRPRIDHKKLRAWTSSVVSQLTGGLNALAARRQVEVIQGTGQFQSSQRIDVATSEGPVAVLFDHAIIAAGSQAGKIPGLPSDDARIMDSTTALELKEIPKRLLVIGGGIIGLEMAAVYHALGSRITLVEMLDRLIADCDPDMVKPLQSRISKRYEAIFLKTQVSKVESRKDGLVVHFQGEGTPASERFDSILVAVGRRPNGHAIGAEHADVHIDQSGFIPVDGAQRTNIPNIFAVGDIADPPLLAHKASHQGKVAAEVIAGRRSSFEERIVPAVAYTDPEIAWTGLTELGAKKQGINFGKGVFPWAASGRALALGGQDGLTKLLFDNESGRIIGMAAVGPNAGDLIAEGTLALEMGCNAEDIGLTIHPHPTLSETIAMAAEAFSGTVTDLYIPKRARN